MHARHTLAHPRPPVPTAAFPADVVRQEAEALLAMASNDALMASVRDAALLISHSGDPLIVAGIGKSGHIGRKIASTFCSLGKPSVFLQAAEASHGDLGVIGENSVVIVLSNSGETSELGDLLAYCEAHQHPIVAITANADSTLGRASRIALAYGKPKEACRNGLAPTTSTTIALALGDALAVTVSEIRGIAPEDFRRYHPGGKLGARLARVADRMRTENLPFVDADTPVVEAVITMSAKGLGVALVGNAGAVEGIITDGDMRRHAARLAQATAGEIATRRPITVDPATPINEAVDLMNAKGITACVVRDATGAFLGLLHIHDCLRGN